MKMKRSTTQVKSVLKVNHIDAPEEGSESVNIMVHVRSQNRLDKLWHMFCTGDMATSLRRFLPSIERVVISHQDYDEGSVFFREGNYTLTLLCVHLQNCLFVLYYFENERTLGCM